MAARSLEAADPVVRGVDPGPGGAHSLASARIRARSREVRYELVALASGVDDVVGSAGGWLFDRVSAGCEATVLVADHGDDRPLRILGARSVDLHGGLASQVRDARPYVLLVGAELYRSDAPVRRGVLETIDKGMTNVMMWGDDWPAELEGLTTAVVHRLSIGALAFKAQALAACGAPSDAVGGVETFRGVDLRACPAGASDQVSAG